jgi:hypothetical protein
MTTTWLMLCCVAGAFLFGLGMFLAVKKSARNSAQLDAIKADLERMEKERKRANQVTDSVRNMRDDDVRRRLQDRTGK